MSKESSYFVLIPSAKCQAQLMLRLGMSEQVGNCSVCKKKPCMAGLRVLKLVLVKQFNSKFGIRVWCLIIMMLFTWTNIK